MRLIHRPFDDRRGDFEKMWRFLQAEYAARGDDAVWFTSRLGDWKYGLWADEKLIPTFFGKYAHVWTDEFDDLYGWVLSENGVSEDGVSEDGVSQETENVFTIFTRAGCDWLYAEILDWTLEQWGPGSAVLKTEVHERQTEALICLARRGWVNTGQACVRRTYDLRAMKDQAVKLPPGYRLVSMAENGDYLSKARLFVNGFGGYDEPSRLDLLKFAYSRQNPIYDPVFDLSVVNADGAHVSTCVGFNDPALSMAEVEKVCTHSGYRKLGLAEAVIRECFNRLKARGIGTAYITGYSGDANSLYEKLGPCARVKWYYVERRA